MVQIVKTKAVKLSKAGEPDVDGFAPRNSIADFKKVLAFMLDGEGDEGSLDIKSDSRVVDQLTEPEISTIDAGQEVSASTIRSLAKRAGLDVEHVSGFLTRFYRWRARKEDVRVKSLENGRIAIKRITRESDG